MSEGERDEKADMISAQLPRITDDKTFLQALGAFVQAVTMSGVVAIDVAAIKQFHVMCETIAFIPDARQRRELATMIVTRLYDTVEAYKQKHDERAQRTAPQPEKGRIILN